MCAEDGEPQGQDQDVGQRGDDAEQHSVGHGERQHGVDREDDEEEERNLRRERDGGGGSKRERDRDRICEIGHRTPQTAGESVLFPNMAFPSLSLRFYVVCVCVTDMFEY